MNSSELIENGKTILRHLWVEEKINGKQYNQLYNLMLEIRVKSAGEWIMNDISYNMKKKF